MFRVRSMFIFSVIIVLSISLSGCAGKTPKATDNWLPQIAGTYNGYILEGNGKMVKGKTSFFRDAVGSIIGEYEMYEASGIATGKLSNLQIVDADRVKCKWEDKYGKGDLEMLFNKDRARFDGRWNYDNRVEKRSWTGLRDSY